MPNYPGHGRYVPKQKTSKPAKPPGPKKPRRAAPAPVSKHPRPDKPRYFIGIDPGKKTGLAVKLRTGHYSRIVLTAFWECISIVGEYPPEETVVVVECPYLIKATYKNVDGRPEEGRMGQRISRNAGSNSREAELLVEGLELLGYHVVQRKPQGAKWSADEYTRFTRAGEPNNEHVRDAARFIFGY